MYPKDYIELCQIIGQDAIAIEAFWTPLKHKRKDGSIGPITDRSIRDRRDADKIIWPTESDMEERLQYVREYVTAAEGTNIGVIFGGFCIFQTLYEFVMGMDNCMLLLMEDEDFFNELMSKSADYYERLVSAAVNEGVDIIFAADDFAFKSGLLVRPEQFKRLWRPHFERILAPAVNSNIPIIFHSDGKIDDCVEMLIDMGVNCLTPMDPSGVDYRDYKKRYGGKVTLQGNVDIQWPLVTGTPADVERDVKAHMDALKPGGRWIAGSAHSIVNYIPHENFVTLINAMHKYGQY
jgi:uroporphyrinogen decarboxylase